MDTTISNYGQPERGQDVNINNNEDSLKITEI